MPEGDTLYRIARTLAAALEGSTVIRFETRLAQLAAVDDEAPVVGRRVDRVRSIGKHLLIELSGDLILRTHLRMNGNWHLYRCGERWLRRRSDMRIVIANEAYEAVGFSVPVAEFLTGETLRRHSELRRLGPDLLAPDFDLDAAVAALLRSPQTVADALLDQSVAAGIGNIYKSEVLFIAGLNPSTSAAGLTAEEAAGLLTTARRLLVANAGEANAAGVFWNGRRRTTGRIDPASSFWVYGRRGLPCRKCGKAIERALQGIDARATYWCPSCQPSRPVLPSA